jgi:hypothetical protein
MSEEVPETADGAIRAWIVAVGFTLVLIGGELMAEKDGVRFWPGFGLAVASLPCYLAAAWWRFLKPKVNNRFLVTLRGVATDARWWFGIILLAVFIILVLPIIREWPEVYQQRSDRELVIALAKTHWLDTKLKEFDEAAKQYDDTYKTNIDKSPTTAINEEAAAKIEKIAKDVLGRGVNLEKHPNFDQNHNCCLPGFLGTLRGVATDAPLAGAWKSIVVMTEWSNMAIDQHNTSIETIDEIRKDIQDQRNIYESIITRSGSK